MARYRFTTDSVWIERVVVEAPDVAAATAAALTEHGMWWVDQDTEDFDPIYHETTWPNDDGRVDLTVEPEPPPNPSRRRLPPTPPPVPDFDDEDGVLDEDADMTMAEFEANIERGRAAVAEERAKVTDLDYLEAHHNDNGFASAFHHAEFTWLRDEILRLRAELAQIRGTDGG
jgi:hypothetical protein